MRSKNVVLLIIAFALIFMGYDSAQSYMSSIFFREAKSGNQCTAHIMQRIADDGDAQFFCYRFFIP